MIMGTGGYVVGERLLKTFMPVEMQPYASPTYTWVHHFIPFSAFTSDDFDLQGFYLQGESSGVHPAVYIDGVVLADSMVTPLPPAGWTAPAGNISFP